MSTGTVQFTFAPRVAIAELQGTLQLALIAVRSLHGISKLLLEDCVRSDPHRHAVIIDRSSDCGEALALVFSGYCISEFGADAVTIERSGARDPQDDGGA